MSNGSGTPTQLVTPGPGWVKRSIEKLKPKKKEEPFRERMVFQDARKMILDSRKSTSEFLQKLGRSELPLFMQKNKLSNALSPDLQTKVRAGRLTSEEAAQVLSTFRDNKFFQRFLVKQLSALPIEDLPKLAIGMIERGVISPDIADAAWLVKTRSAMTNVLVTYAGGNTKDAQKLGTEINNALRNAKPGDKIDLLKIVQTYVPETTKELDAALNTIKRGMEIGGTRGTAMVENGLNRVESIYNNYGQNLRHWTRARSNLFSDFRRDLEELASVRGMKNTTDEITKFVADELNPVLKRMRNPARIASEMYLDANSVSKALIETAPSLVGSAANVQEALEVVRDAGRWRNALSGVGGSLKSMFVKPYRWMFGNKAEMEFGVLRRRPGLTFIVLAAIGLGIYHYPSSPGRISNSVKEFAKGLVVPARIAEEKKRKALAEKVRKSVENSEVFKVLNTDNRSFMIDPENHGVAVWIINRRYFIDLALNNKQNTLDLVVGDLRKHISEDPVFASKLKKDGYRLYSEGLRAEYKRGLDPIAKYETDVAIMLVKKGIDLQPKLPKIMFKGENQRFINNNPDVWYLYNMAANFVPPEILTVDVVNDGISKLNQSLGKMTYPMRMKVMDLVTLEITRLARELGGVRLKEEGLPVLPMNPDSLYLMLGINPEKIRGGEIFVTPVPLLKGEIFDVRKLRSLVHTMLFFKTDNKNAMIDLTIIKTKLRKRFGRNRVKAKEQAEAAVVKSLEKMINEFSKLSKVDKDTLQKSGLNITIEKGKIFWIPKENLENNLDFKLLVFKLLRKV